MHPEAYEYVRQAVEKHGPFKHVLDVGGRNINGTPKDWFPYGDTEEYVVLDIFPHPTVQVVADFLEWENDLKFDAIVCCEVMEHHPKPYLFVRQIGRHLKPGGTAILTMAADPRLPHSGVNGGPLLPGEYYGNVDPKRLLKWIRRWIGTEGEVEHHVDRGDLYAIARRRDE